MKPKQPTKRMSDKDREEFHQAVMKFKKAISTTGAKEDRERGKI